MNLLWSVFHCFFGRDVTFTFLWSQFPQLQRSVAYPSPNRPHQVSGCHVASSPGERGLGHRKDFLERIVGQKPGSPDPLEETKAGRAGENTDES